MRYAREIVSLAVIVGLFLTPCVIEAQCSKRDITGKCINNISEPSAKTDSQTIEPEWGTSYTTCKSIPANTFFPFDSSITWDDSLGDGWIVRTGGSSYWFDANVDLPTGAKVWNMYVNVFDNSASGDVWAWFVECATDYAPTCPFYPLDNSLKTNGTPGYVKLYQSLSGQNITIDNLNKTYYVRVNLGATDQSSFGSVQVCYALQISPAPGTATFWDVPVGSFWHQYVEALAASGITTGYGDGTFRPDNYVTRGQMAAFFSRALGLHWPH